MQRCARSSAETCVAARAAITGSREAGATRPRGCPSARVAAPPVKGFCGASGKLKAPSQSPPLRDHLQPAALREVGAHVWLAAPRARKQPVAPPARLPGALLWGPSITGQASPRTLRPRMHTLHVKPPAAPNSKPPPPRAANALGPRARARALSIQRVRIWDRRSRAMGAPWGLCMQSQSHSVGCPHACVRGRVVLQSGPLRVCTGGVARGRARGRKRRGCAACSFL